MSYPTVAVVNTFHNEIKSGAPTSLVINLPGGNAGDSYVLNCVVQNFTSFSIGMPAPWKGGPQESFEVGGANNVPNVMRTFWRRLKSAEGPSNVTVGFGGISWGVVDGLVVTGLGDVDHSPPYSFASASPIGNTPYAATGGVPTLSKDQIYLFVAGGNAGGFAIGQVNGNGSSFQSAAGCVSGGRFGWPSGAFMGQSGQWFFDPTIPHAIETPSFAGTQTNGPPPPGFSSGSSQSVAYIVPFARPVAPVEFASFAQLGDGVPGIVRGRTAGLDIRRMKRIGYGIGILLD